MNLTELLSVHSDDVGDGVSSKTIDALEAKLEIQFPSDFKQYLLSLNYAEIFGDPIYGINQADEPIDLYKQNKHKEHFRYGFLEVFANDIDGTIYIRPDTGQVYNASYSKPIAKNFTEFVNLLINQV